MKQQVFSELERVFLLGVLTLNISACGQVALKRGADGADFATAKAECASTAEASAPLDACLKDKGWVVLDRDENRARAAQSDARPDDQDPLANTNSRLSSKQIELAAEGPPTDTSNRSTADSPTTAKGSGGLLGGISVSHTDNRPGVIEPARPSESARAKQPPTSASPVYRDTDLVRVASWWKSGGNGEALIADGNVCKEAIGETAEASYNFSTLSVSVLKCLEKKGWRYLLAQQQP